MAKVLDNIFRRSFRDQVYDGDENECGKQLGGAEHNGLSCLDLPREPSHRTCMPRLLEDEHSRSER